MLSRLLSKIWLHHKLLQGFRGKSGGKLHKTMRGGGSRAETTCGRGGEMLSAGGRNHAGKKPPFRLCPQKGTCVFGHQTDKPATSCHWLRLLSATSECLELPRVLPNAYSDPHAQRFSSVVLPLMTVRLPAVNRNVRKSGGNCQSNILVYFRRRRGAEPARLGGRCLSLDTS